jgi:uncharacterized protein (UPF0548 family)
LYIWRKPSPEAIQEYIAAQRRSSFSYVEIGQTRFGAPKGYTTDHNRVEVGRGACAYANAKNAIRQWKMFAMPWIELCWPEAPIEINATVAVLARHLGFWSLNACRIVYVVEEQGAVESYGFAYGTLADHAASGEERFTVELDTRDQSVWYDVLAFSKPKGIAKLGFPVARILQKRFARDSKAAMFRATQG